MSKTIIIACGNPDAEMAAVERLGGDAGCVVVHAYHNGRRVHAGNAYSADAIFLPDGTPYTIPDGATVLRVECDGPAFGDIAADRIIVCDHHRPGDPGYGCPPEQFFEASSLGQVLAQIAKHRQGVAAGAMRSNIRVRADRRHILADVTIASGTPKRTMFGGCTDPDCCMQHPGVTDDGYPMVGLAITVSGSKAHQLIQQRIMIAAADHCLEAAYRGRCPGVDPDALMRWRAESRAEFQRRPVEAVLADIAAARERLLRAIDRSTEYADLRGVSIPELPEAAAREGIPFLADQSDRDGRRKVVLMAVPQGSDLVQRFMSGEIVPGLTDYYGDPARGFAGGYYA